jgi:hypothetical protein
MELNMTFSKKVFGATLFSLCVVLSGCSNAPKQIQSGFLGDYSQFTKSQNYKDTSTYSSPNFNKEMLAQVKQIKLVPFEIWVKHDNTDGINTEQLTKLHIYFHETLKLALQKNYQITEAANEETLTIRGAFSGVKLMEPEISATDFLPIKLVFNAGNSAYLKSTDQKDIISEVSIEVEFLLGNQGERVFAMTASKQLDMTVSNSEEGNLKAVKSVMDIWINNFIKKLAEVNQSVN